MPVYIGYIGDPLASYLGARALSPPSTKVLREGMKAKAKQWELRKRYARQTQLKELMDRWMLQRFKSIISDQLPTKYDNIVLCRLTERQEQARTSQPQQETHSFRL